jgi:hypothetical protein
MRIIKAAEFARIMGASPRTVRYWCQTPGFAVRISGDWWVNLDWVKAEFDIEVADDGLHTQHWVRAASLEAFEIPSSTLELWCQNNPHLAKKMFDEYFIDLDDLGADGKDLELLRRFADLQRVAAITPKKCLGS